jgi:two-component system, cell cycle sensor histidine kinase and response regulator CckA
MSNQDHGTAGDRPSASRNEPERPPGRVLVVDDDAAVGKAITRSLRQYQVVFAQSANGALARIQAGGQFVAVVCDLNMPGMNGMQFHGEVVKIDPALARSIVFVTGAETPEFRTFLATTRNTCVMKPFLPDELASAVAKVARAAPPHR